MSGGAGGGGGANAASAAVARWRASAAAVWGRVSRFFAARARSVPFRLAVAAGLLAAHLAVTLLSGERFDAGWNAAPGQPPAFANPARDSGSLRWNRLLVSRWDAGQYIGLGLRGYQHCAPRGAPQAAYNTPACNLVFYPTYGLVGRLASLGGLIPIDYALLIVSLLASFVFLFLWTGDALVSRLGLAETYIALLMLNVFTTGFTLVTVQTEPLALVTSLGAFVALYRRRFLLAALLAGAASGVRITGVAAGAACGAALLVELVRDRPATAREWARRLGVIALCAWGQAAIMAYHWYRFGTPRAYLHAHALAFKHEISLSSLLHPDPAWLIRSMEQPLHEGVWLVVALLWFLAGHREALRRFPLPERVYWYVVFIGTVGIAAVGQLPISFVGMNRYLLLALPLFFAMACLMRTRPALLVFWLLVSAWHYWQVDLCTYTGGPGDRVLRICHAAHWVGRI